MEDSAHGQANAVADSSQGLSASADKPRPEIQSSADIPPPEAQRSADIPRPEARLQSDFEGIWNPATKANGDDDDDKSRPSSADGVDSAKLLETRQERYARERKLSWSLPPAYDDLGNPDDLIDNDSNSRRSSQMNSPDHQQYLSENKELDLMRDFPPLPSAKDSDDQQQQIQRLKQPNESPASSQNNSDPDEAIDHRSTWYSKSSLREEFIARHQRAQIQRLKKTNESPASPQNNIDSDEEDENNRSTWSSPPSREEYLAKKKLAEQQLTSSARPDIPNPAAIQQAAVQNKRDSRPRVSSLRSPPSLEEHLAKKKQAQQRQTSSRLPNIPNPKAIQQAAGQNNLGLPSMSSLSSPPSQEEHLAKLELAQQQRTSGSTDIPNPVTSQQAALPSPQQRKQFANMKANFMEATHSTVARFPGAGEPRGMQQQQQQEIPQETEKPSRSFTIRHFKPYLNDSGLSLFPAMNFISLTVTTDRLVKLNFAGLDQLTDIFFRILLDHNVIMPHLQKFSAAGCVLLTDASVRWLCKISPMLQKITLIGCGKITSAGLSTLLDKQPPIKTADLSCTGVTTLPLSYGSTNVDLNLDGCPVVCPIKRKLNKAYLADPRSYVPDGTALFEVSQYKVVVLKSGTIELNFGKYLRDGPGDTAADNQPMTTTRGITIGKYRLNVYEIKRDQTAQDLIISDGSICLFPFYLDTCTPDRLDHNTNYIFRKIAYALSKSEYVVPVLVGLHNGKMEGKESEKRLADLKEGVLKLMQASVKSLDEKLHIMIKRKWLQHDYDIKGQLYAGDAGIMLDKLRMTPIFSEIVDTHRKVNPEKFLKEARSHLHAEWPWMMVNCAETQTVMDRLLEVKEPIIGFSETEALEKFGQAAELAGFKAMKMHQPYLKTIARVMHQMGSLLYFPEVDRCPLITDLGWFANILGIVMNPPPTDERVRRQLRFINKDQPVWTKECLQKALARHVPDNQLALLLPLLLHYGILIECAVDRITDQDVSYLYVARDPLPNEPCIQLAHLWPEAKYDSIVQRNKYYQFNCGAPLSLFSSFLGQLAKLFKFTLLWKCGCLIRQGVVDVLVDLELNDIGEPVVCLSGRTEYQRSEATAVRVNCLWSVMNKISAVLDYTIKRYSCFATVVVPCPTCIPTMANSEIVKDNDVWFYHVILLKAGATRGLKCRSKKYKCSELSINNTRTMEQLLGPDLSFVSKHLTSQLISCKDALSDYNRCALCQGCAVKGRDCPGYGLSGKTLRHCKCEDLPNLPLCLSCGICQRCENYLQAIDHTLHPQTFRQIVWKGYRLRGVGRSESTNPIVSTGRSKSQSGIGRSKSSKGLQDGKVVQHPKFSWFHTQKAQLYVSDNVYFCPELFNTIEILFYKGMKASVGLVRDDLTPVLTFNPTDGCTGTDWSFTKSAGQKKWKIKNGTTFSMKIRYLPVSVRETSSTSNRTSFTYAVDFYKLGERLWTEYLPEGNVKVALTGSGAGSMIIQTPTISTEAPLSLSHPDAKDDKLYVEVERQDDPTQLVLCSIRPTPGENNFFTVATEDGAVQMRRDDPKIHPLGYSFVPNTERTLFLLPKHREMSSVPTMFYKRKKKKPLATTKDTAVVTCIEDLSTLIEKKIISPAPLWFFTKEQRHGWEPSIIDLCRCQRFYESTEAQLCSYTRSTSKFVEWAKSAVEEQLAYEYLVPTLLLPVKIDEMSLMYPNKPPHSKPEMFQAVQLCASSAERLDLHLLDMKGMTLSEKQGELTNFFLPFHVIMSLGCQVTLPGYAKMLPQIADGSLDKDLVQYYFRELLLYITYSLIIFNAGGRAPEAGDLPEDTVKFLDSVLEHSATETKEKNPMAMCPAHRQKDKIDPNDFDDIPDIRGYLQFLKTAKLEQTVEKLPSDFFQRLSGLEEFAAEKCQIRELPNGLSLCSRLTTLNLARSQISHLPQDMIQLKNRLKELDISHLKLSALPDVVTKLTKLGTLTADCLLLNTLPDAIGNLVNLDRLSLAGSCLSCLPKSFVNLKKLTRLSLRGVPWPKVKHGHYLTNETFDAFLTKWNLKNYFEEYEKQNGVGHSLLKPFDEDSNLTLDPVEMGKLNATLFNMFQRFGFHGTNEPAEECTGGFPAELLELSNLTKLDLSYQGIVSVPENIGQLKQLKVLILSENPYLTSLPGPVGSLPLERLDISECPSLRTPPREITSKGFFPVMAYLRRLTTGSAVCKRTKLMLVGLGGAGKSSLVKALLSGTNKAHLESGQDITDGIDIHSWTITKKEDSVTYSVWDFAGQTVYYNTHQFFLSNRAIYLLLWNLRLGAEHAGLDFWLSSISVHAPNAPILVVGSHLDQVDQFSVPKQRLLKKYPQIAGFHEMSTLTGTGVTELQEKLFAISLQEKYMGESIPEVWLNFEKAVIGERGKADIINYQRMEEIAYASGIFDELETTQAIRFLHDLGTVQHFENEFLKDQVVIKPQWLVDVMASVVSVKDSPIKKGEFKHSDVPRVWSEHPKKLHNWLLRLTERFDLTYPLPEKAMNIVPCLLPETEPKISWSDIGKTSVIKESKLLYRFEYLPVGLFNRGQVRLYEYCDNSIIWKKGSLLTKNGHKALLSQVKDNTLLVKCQGPRPENMLYMIHEVFETLIQESFKGIVYDYKIPCPDCLGVARDPYMFKASTIRRAAGLKTPFLQCSKNFHVLSIAYLTGLCPPSDSQDYDLHLKNTVNSLNDIRHDLSADVFISCCQDDIPDRGQDIVDPRKIRASIEAVGYTCWFEATISKEGLDERNLALRDAKIIVAMISNNYVNDEDCSNLFKFARTILKKPLLLVAVGPPVAHDWKQSTLGMLIADEVYCNMQRVEHTKTKTDELLKLLNEKLSEGNLENTADSPPCFFSYCWKNSKRAVDMGQKSSSDAIGYGDPRDMKDYLEENGVKSWIDIERAGAGGLFEDIAEGLRDATLMVACVSDEYTDSLNCQMEFRFAAKALDLPIIIAVVGKSQRWRATEIGMMSLEYPQVNFEESADDGMRKLLELVTKHTKTKSRSSVQLKGSKAERDRRQKKASYHELCELAQRKMLRQLTSYSDEYETQPFPRIIIIDFAEPDGDTVASRDDNSARGERQMLTNRRSTTGLRINNAFLQRNFCFRFFCENEQGWHIEGRSIPVQESVGESDLASFASYLARIMVVIKHNTKIQLNCIGGEDGNNFITWLEENCKKQTSDYQNAYQELRRCVSKTIRGKSCGSLARCLTTSGKVFWLCESHQKGPQITLMSNNTSQNSNLTTDASLESNILAHLRPLNDWEEQVELVKKRGSEANGCGRGKADGLTPTPKPRTSLLKNRGESSTSSNTTTKTFNPKAKFKAAGYAAQASIHAKNYEKGSKTCDII